MFNLLKNQSELASYNSTAAANGYQQYTPSRDVTRNNFCNGSIHIPFAISGLTWWNPSQSYLRLRCTLTKKNGDPLIIDNDTGPSMNLAANLFQNMEFRINGKTVSQISSYVPQIDTLHTRMTKSKAWLDSVGASLNFMNADVDARIRLVSSDGGKKSSFELIWHPPLSIFQVHHALPVGNYELIMTPVGVNQLQNAAVETTDPGADDFKFEVEELFFFAHQTIGPRIENTKYHLDLAQVRCQTAQLDTPNFSQKSFDVSPSTHALTIAYQDGRLDDPQYPATQFDFNFDEALYLERFYVDYAGQQKPSPDADPSYNETENIDRTTQRYLETIMGTGMYWECGGAEGLSDWQERGPYYHFPWPRDGSDASTRVRVHQAFRAGTDVSNGRVLLFDHSRSVATVTIKDGRVVDVMMQDV